MDATTISQALRKIKKLKGALKEQLDRANLAVLFEEKPAFLFAESHEQAEALREELIKLETALRVTNATTKVEFGSGKITLAEATLRLQEYRSKIAWLRALPTQAEATRTITKREREDYGTPAVETKHTYVCALPEAKRAERVAHEQSQFDALNDAVESVNHRTTLVQG